MTNRETLLALADRCEAETEAYQHITIMAAMDAVARLENSDEIWARALHCHKAGAYLDAAMSLVPEGMAWTVGQNVHHRHWVASLNYLDEEGAPQSMAGSKVARSPALALCAAALRTRATLDPTGEKA